jgi:hypothetical protein
MATCQVIIASTTGTEDPGSNAASHSDNKNKEMLLSIVQLQNNVQCL